jgi:uncharacterized protein YrrD
MNAKQLAVLAATALAMAPLDVAAQQSADVTEYQEAEDDDMLVQSLKHTVDEIEDMDLKNADGDEIGEVEEVLTDGSGQPVAIAVEVGGFLGVGDREVVLGLDQVQSKDDELVTSADKATIEGLPDWDD